MSGLLRGLLRSPYGTIRNALFQLAIICLAFAVWAVFAMEWLYLLGFGSGFVVLLVFALIDQHESEASGRVEREQQRQAEVFATRAAWPAWKRRFFYGSLTGLVLFVGVWRLVDGR